jgi:AraC-like DNA-binding protein
VPGLSVRYHLPAPALRNLVSAYFLAAIDDEAEIEDLLQPQWASIQFVLTGRWSTNLGDQRLDPMPDAVVVGPTSHALRVHGTGPTTTVGAGILPLGWARLVGRPADTFADQVAPLDALFGEAAGDLLDGLRRDQSDAAKVTRLDDFLLDRMKARPEVSCATVQAHRLLLDSATASVEGFARAMGITVRQLERLCRKAFGFPPKLLLRRQRFLRTLSSMRGHPEEPWSELLDDSYVDQSHFNKDFHRFLGMSPSAYFALPRALAQAGADARARLLGAPFHGLHTAPGNDKEAPA